ncbi:MAG: PEP-CTERM sorting domain-containing protein [Phycisphaeraceae bacterium]|nr:PEP-CTERM sorting domain-containing protein [Phycisphaeraceae bacterium]
MNPRISRVSVLRSFLVAAVVGGSASMAQSAIVQATAFGDQMAGGTLTVTWVPGPGGPLLTTSAIIQVGGVDSAIALLPDPFGNPGPGAIFRMTGDTFIGDWFLENLADAFIVRAEFDLSTSISVFDNDLIADTPGSGLGRLGVVYQPIPSTAPMEIASGEFNLWGGAKNAGDLYTHQFIDWAPPTLAGGGFGPQQVYVWLDDTDVIPAPGALALLGLAGLSAGARRRRRA